MTKHLFITLIALTAIFIPATAQDAFFDKYAGRRGVTVVTIGKEMLEMMPEVDALPDRMEKITDKMDRLRILKCEGGLVRTVRDASLAEVRNNYKKLLEINKEGKLTSVYTRRTDRKKNVIMAIVEQRRRLTVICVTGSMKAKDIQQLLND